MIKICIKKTNKMKFFTIKKNQNVRQFSKNCISFEKIRLFENFITPKLTSTRLKKNNFNKIIYIYAYSILKLKNGFFIKLFS